MHNIYFTRHGETVWNVENKICGMTGCYIIRKNTKEGLYHAGIPRAAH